MNWKKLVFLIILILAIIIGTYCLYTSYTFNNNQDKDDYLKFENFKFGLCSINAPYEDIKIIKNIITKDEAQELINWAKPRLGEATLIAYKTKDKSHRNNKVAWLDKNHPISKKISKKMVELTDLPEKNIEKIQ